MQTKIEIEREREVILVEIAFEAALPFRERARECESREELAKRTRRRRPFDFSQRLNYILSRYVVPIHISLTSSLPLQRRRIQEAPMSLITICDCLVLRSSFAFA